jgi:hypothetical protein
MWIHAIFLDPNIYALICCMHMFDMVEAAHLQLYVEPAYGSQICIY